MTVRLTKKSGEERRGFLQSSFSHKRRGSWLRRICLLIVLASLTFFLVYISPDLLTQELPSIPDRICALQTAPGSVNSGFAQTPVDSTVLMLYSPSSATARFCYSDSASEGGSVEEAFLRVAASYVASPHEGPRSPYYDFFAAHDATLWTVDSATRVATPMRLDVVYTYVNPKAPSFERNLKARGLSFEPWRYRDWEELRYALRSLREFVLSSGALAQYHRRHAADVQRLGELGYQVNMSGAGTVDGVVSLVQRVYLVLSDVDHVPAWLDTEKFPELRVVTHADMFSPEDAAWVLPTLNSNVIESGLHHIPGISRFFLYSANDMMLGRQLSFFDLFRPLSPLRQRLHLYSLSRGSEGSANTLHTSSETGRAALLFEPVLHSSTKANFSEYMEQSERVQAMRARKEVGSCLFQKARTTLEAKGRSDGWSQETVIFASWATTTAFRLHNPRYGLTPRGAGVSRDYYYYLSSMRLHGIAPPFGYAHTPQLVDREVYRRLNEVEFFDFTNTTRSAYEREMYPYSSIDEYAVFAVAMMRGMERHLWGSMWPAAPADTFADVRGTLKSWWATNVLRDPTGVARRLSSRLSGFHADISMFGALYGNTWGAQLQRPDLSLELGYWWVRGAVEPARPARELEALKSLYAIPEVGAGDTCSSNSPVWTARSDEHYYSLLHDMFHHTRPDNTFLFEMIDSDMKAVLVSSRLQHEWLKRPLFMGFNDNLPINGNYTEYQVLFHRLMNIAIQEAPSAPWERYET
ncbi:hypothetical protein JKF63_04875 [Porcisia hertigi]|uniref:Stealth protein CR2 conserved region 2 domain-containing protein n=1 Tax=Porcisia hertigi TaxID=2761500 RepID=A0A836IMX2_9TRYP|nr:hypothetical protein JKF63_04875 [Porcisia hertigi]